MRDPQLLLAFGPISAPPAIWFEQVRARWPRAELVYVTAGGQIDGGDVLDDDVVITGIELGEATVHVRRLDGAGVIPCAELGRSLGEAFADVPDLKHVLLFVDGLHVNGAAFTQGLVESLPVGVTASGGLASDGTNFVSTGVGLNGPPRPREVVGIGFAGDSIVVGTGSAGGWVPFGPERTITRGNGPIVAELDGEPALSVYKRFLGNLASELPGSALLFPLALSSIDGPHAVVRTILGIDENENSLRFAGDVPEGHKVRFMRSTNDQLLDGAAKAAQAAREAMGETHPSLMLCISCIGRRAVLKSRVAEEVDEVGLHAPGAVVTGYYSNGEISPPERSAQALLHNQTMTVTAIGER